MSTAVYGGHTSSVDFGGAAARSARLHRRPTGRHLLPGAKPGVRNRRQTNPRRTGGPSPQRGGTSGRQPPGSRVGASGRQRSVRWGAGDQAAPGTENAATVDSVGPEGSVALLGSLTKDELLRLRFYTFQMVRAIVVALAAAAVFTDNEVDWGTLSSAAGGLIVLMDLIDKALEGHVKDGP